jgi:hypothetical protein
VELIRQEVRNHDMAEKQRKKSKPFARAPETGPRGVVPPLSVATVAPPEDNPTLDESLRGATVNEEPVANVDISPQEAFAGVLRTPSVAQETDVSPITERRSVMEQNSETMNESGITSTGAAIKDGVVDGLKGINEIGTGLVDLVGNTLSETLRTTGVVARDGLSFAKDVATGTVQTVADVGTRLTTNATHVAKEVLTGVGEVGGDVVNVAQQAIKGVITGIADLGAMVGEVAERAARGTVETTKEIGGNVGGLARSTVEGTIEAADAIGGAAVKTATHILVSVVEGVKEVLSAALPRARAPRE